MSITTFVTIILSLLKIHTVKAFGNYFSSKFVSSVLNIMINTEEFVRNYQCSRLNEITKSDIITDNKKLNKKV